MSNLLTHDTEQVLRFRDGIPGFPEHENFMLVRLAEGSPFQQLQSLDDEDMSLIVCVPWLFFPDYAPELSPLEQAELGIEELEDAVVFCSVTLEDEEIFVNLLGPFVVNANTREGRQLVLAGSEYPVRASISLGGD